ncbi:MAG: MarR family winged helix-turn-helix transcriptional regulator [Lachnospiraceae bacterium]|jgi:DNA-binding MarR family transcriptional regulator
MDENFFAENHVSLIHRINRINDEINALYHRASVKMGLADSEMVILYLLCDYGSITQRQIIQYTGMSKQTLSSAVKRMEQNGWIRHGDESGNRRELLPTTAGNRMIRDLILPLMNAEESIFSSWTEDERRRFLQLNEKYRDALRGVVDSMPFRDAEHNAE